MATCQEQSPNAFLVIKRIYTTLYCTPRTAVSSLRYDTSWKREKKEIKIYFKHTVDASDPPALFEVCFSSVSHDDVDLSQLI